MVQLQLNANIAQDTSQTLKNIGGLKDDGEDLESRIETLVNDGYVVSVKMDGNELILTVENA